jgi:hypothetical protein
MNGVGKKGIDVCLECKRGSWGKVQQPTGNKMG